MRRPPGRPSSGKEKNVIKVGRKERKREQKNRDKRVTRQRKKEDYFPDMILYIPDMKVSV